MDHPCDGHHLLPAGQIPGPCSIAIGICQSLLIVRHWLALIGGKADGCRDDVAFCIKDHQFHALFIGEILYIVTCNRDKILRGPLPVIGKTLVISPARPLIACWIP